MSRLIDGEPFTPPTHCRCGEDVETSRYLGPHATATQGDYLLLAVCRACSTSFVIEAVSGASPCCGCGHLIHGDSEDPKACVGLADGSIRIACLDCAPKLAGVREAFGLDGAQAQLELCAEAIRVRTEWKRRKSITLGEVRAEGGA